ncbi:MAG: DUF354 domain-containing protein [Bacteroidetes bacterium]|nr:DUF354 domain-containing protein [Bacteroidota bacterium]
MIWFDLDNSPHVPVFRPLFGELKKNGIDFIVTARDYAQTKSLLDMWEIEHTLIGKHGGKSKAGKIANLLKRAGQLRNFIKGMDISAAVSHGSRTQVIAAKMMKIPSYVMLDYEYTESFIFNKLAARLLIPDLIPGERLKDAGFNLGKVIRYPGFKENLYLEDFIPDDEFRKKNGIPEEKILIVIRPPALLGNYHNKESEELFRKAVEYFTQSEDTYTIIISRTKEDAGLIKDFTSKGNVTLLKKPVDGLQLLYAADMTLSGGGTMNRESALLGTPTYSIFRGRKPYLDEHLESLGKLIFINKQKDIEQICIEKKQKNKYNYTFTTKSEIFHLFSLLSNKKTPEVS